MNTTTQFKQIGCDKDDPTGEPRKKWYRRCGFLMIGMLIWLVFLLFPRLLNGPPLFVGRFVIYGAQQLSSQELGRIVESAETRLIHYSQPLPQKITIIFSEGIRFKVFNPLAWHAFAATNAAQQIWFNRIDHSRSTFNFAGMGNHHRSVDGTLAHEVIHVAMRETFSVQARWTLPKWIQEGYCDYIAQESSLDYQKGVAQGKKCRLMARARFFDFRSRLAVSQLIERENMTIDALVNSPDIHRMNVDRLALKYANATPGQ